MELLKMFNIGFRFLLEIAILVIFGYWGFKTGAGTFAKILLGIGGPFLFAMVWGMALAPKSSMRLDDPWLFLLELVIFALAGWALHSTGKVRLAITFGAIYIINKILMIIWRQ